MLFLLSAKIWAFIGGWIFFFYDHKWLSGTPKALLESPTWVLKNLNPVGLMSLGTSGIQVGKEEFWKPQNFLCSGPSETCWRWKGCGDLLLPLPGQQLQLQEELWPIQTCVLLKSCGRRLACLTSVWAGLCTGNLLMCIFSEVSKNDLMFRMVEGKASHFQKRCCTRSVFLTYIYGTRTRNLIDFYQDLMS